MLGILLRSEDGATAGQASTTRPDTCGGGSVRVLAFRLRHPPSLPPALKLWWTGQLWRTGDYGGTGKMGTASAFVKTTADKAGKASRKSQSLLKSKYETFSDD
jgi:hypothetical protein